MNGIRVCLIILTAGFVLLFSSACRDKTESGPGAVDAESIIFQSKVDNLVSITISPDAEVFGATFIDGIARYTHDGDLIELYPGTEFITGLYYSGGLIYGYHYIDKNILEFNPASGETRTVYSNLAADDICCLAVSGDHIVMITIPEYKDFIVEDIEGDFQDLGKQFIAININSGELTELPGIQHPICLYQSSGGKLYVYARPENQYILFTYDVEKQTATREAVMDDIGNLWGFAYEYNSFIYYYMGIKAKKMPDGKLYSVTNIDLLTFGTGSFSYYKGNLVILDQRSNDINRPVNHGYDCSDYGGLCFLMPDVITSIQTLQIGPEFVVHITNGYDMDQNGDAIVEDRGYVNISAAYWDQLFSIPSIRARSGITGVYIDQPSGDSYAYNEFLTSIMAGNNSIDIYILTMNSSTSRALRDQGGFVPLTGSAAIQTYLDSCFDWVKEAATRHDGEIWMLPLDYNALMLWYSPENFERFNVDPADVSTFDGYLQVLERLNREKGDFFTFSMFLSGVEYYWFTQYEMTYNDYDNKMVNFDTDVFRRYFQNMWTGWDINGDRFEKPSHHPLIQFDQTTLWTWNEVEFPDEIFPLYDPERVIFKSEMYSIKLDSGYSMEDWRVLPLPLFSESVQHNYLNCSYALVNPFSNNKELAIEFLEAAARDMLSAVTKPVFVQKDLSAYEGHFDMSIPVYTDLHNIFRSGAVIENIFPEDYISIVADYQKWRLSLQEAVDEIQRRVVFWVRE